MQLKYFSYKPSDFKGKFFQYFSEDAMELKRAATPFMKRYKNCLYIVDKNLPVDYLEKVEKITGVTAKNIVFIDSSEKSLDRIVKIWDKMVSIVPTLAIAIGGGTISDLTGFASATYQRGIPHILFPTTVLSMVDASIGGKTAIDYNNVKNSVGAIHYPIATFSYLPFLKTLNIEEYNSGFGEIAKSAVLFSKDFFDRLLTFSEKYQTVGKSLNPIEEFFISSKIKADICEEPGNGKVRLLYGHAVGHALEKYEKKLRHGDCVAVGMHIEGALACMLGIWNKQEWLSQYKMIKNFHLPAELPKEVTYKALIEKMLLYKRLVNNESFLFSVPETIGRVKNQDSTCVISVKKEEMLETFKKTALWISKNLNVQH